MEKPTIREIENRIDKDIKFFGGKMPDRTAAAWGGYLAGLYEWGLISLNDYDRVVNKVKIDNSPVVGIMLGR